MRLKTTTQAIRTVLFYAVFAMQTAIIAALIACLGLLLPHKQQLSRRLARYWCRSTLILLRWITGLQTRVSGMENIPTSGCIIASKHQSDWDALAVYSQLSRPVYIVKQELMRIPVFGLAARFLGCIAVNRRNGGAGMQRLIEQVRSSVEQGSHVVIYPEGTRRPPDAPAGYRRGIARMYAELGVPVVPVALNSGLFWGRNSQVIRQGTAEAKFLVPIQAGLSAAEFLERLTYEIETESEKLRTK